MSDRADGGWNFTPYSYAKEAVVQLEARPFVADAEAAACKDVQRQKRAAVRAGMEAQFDKKRFLSMFKTGYVWVDQRDALDFKDQETGSGIDGEPYRLIRMKLRDVALRVDDGDSEDACQKVLVYTFVLDDGVTWTAEDPFETWGDLKLAKGFYWQNPISAKWPKSFQAAIRNQKVMLGMSREQARVAWGAPDDINTTITAGRRSEQWVYDNKVYIYFDNGRLSSIQN